VASGPNVEGAYSFENLVGIPSYHYDPIFGQIACRALSAFSPSVVALELPPEVEPEMDWAASCWPGPVVVASPTSLFPFVPGDSIFEAFRAARTRGIAVVLIDLQLPEPGDGHEDGQGQLPLLGPEFAPRASALFLDTTDALLAAAGPPREIHLAREAHMAAALAELMAENERVMWVGGMAHWTRIVARLADHAFDATAVIQPHQAEFRRMRLAPSALYRMTGRLPWLVAQYGVHPAGFEEVGATQAMALEATRQKVGAAEVVLVLPGHTPSPLDGHEEPEGIGPVDVARTLLYARNLALTAEIRERPDFGELLLAAAATIGPRYAGRLYETATAERASDRALQHAALEWDIKDGHERYRCGDEILNATPYRPARGGWLIDLMEVRRRARDELYRDLPGGAQGKRRWNCHPEDEERYVSFVHYMLRRASQSDPGESKSVPFSSGLLDGLDIRATLRDWAKGTVYVREEQRGQMNFTNGAIDWTSESEHSDILSGVRPGGWIDPSLTQLGSCGRTCGSPEVLERDPWVQVDERQFSFVTLDLPTTARTKADSKAKNSFYDQVIMPLVKLKGSAKDNLCGWLDIMFSFCSGKPFAYYSRYVPSPRIRGIAQRHKVGLRHFPLRLLPTRLTEQNRTFRFMNLTREQWDEFERRRARAQGTWSASPPSPHLGEPN
jgi:hypothetical protein